MWPGTGWPLIMMAMGDSITGRVGSDGRNVAIGKGIDQDNREYGNNRVNIRIDERPPVGQRNESDIYGRIEDLELVVYGQERFNVPGLLRQQVNLHRWIVINTLLLALALIMIGLSTVR